MATETLILRPVLVTNPANCTYYPSDTSSDQIHTLVSEEVADNDATYIIAKTQTNSPNFSFSIPESYQDRVPLGIKLCGVAKRYDSSEVETLIGLYWYATSTSSSNAPITIGSFENDDWTYFSISYSEEHIEGAYNRILNDPQGSHLSVYRSNASKNDAEGIAITQLYLELTYEKEESTTSYAVYLKNNGVWETNRGVVYKKIDGSWQEATPASLSTDIKYKVIDQRQYEDQ